MAQVTTTVTDHIQVDFSGGPGNRTDWVGLYAVMASNHSPSNWKYLSNTQTAPSVGLVSATVTFLLPEPGMYQIRVFANDAVTVTLATSASFTISSGPTPPAPPGELTRVGTLADEKVGYKAFGWTWDATQEPNGPPNPTGSYVIGAGQDVHGDFEADDIWQNLAMYKRTGNITYRQMAEKWATYYNNYYETDLVSGGAPDSAYGYDHLFGFGLIDWYEESGDAASLATAIRLGEISVASYPTWKGRHPRLDARALLLAIRLWEKTLDTRWRTHMDAVRDTVMDNAILATRGTMRWDAALGIYLVWDGITGHNEVMADILQIGWLAWALTRYYEVTGSTDTAVKDRLVAMAQFTKQYALGPTGQSGSTISFLSGSPEYQVDDGSQVFHAYTTFWSDILTRGYLLTGDVSFRDRAKLHWQNGTDVANNRVGRFVNDEWLSNTSFYRFNGELTYTHTFIAVIGTLVPPPTLGYTLANNEWQRVALATTQRYIPRNYTASNTLENQSDPVAREYGGIHYGNGKIFYFGGGHGGYAGNDVEAYDILNKRWDQSYKPEVCSFSDNSCNRIYQGGPAPGLTTAGRPYTEHTLQKLSWNPVIQKLIGILGAGTLSYDPVAKVWAILGPTLQGSDITYAGLLSYDPTLQANLAVLGEDNALNQQHGVYKFSNGQWERIGNIPVHGRAPASTYLADLQKHFVFFPLDSSYWLFNAQTVTWTVVASPPDWIDSFDYDSRNHKVIGVQHFASGVFKVFTYSPATNIWTTLAPPIVAPAQAGGGPSVWTPLFKYDSVNNVFIFLKASGGSGGTGGWTETWVYRYAN